VLAYLRIYTQQVRLSIHVEDLKEARAAIKFISFEPLLAAVELVDLIGIDWVIVGGESGPKARRIDKAWISSIRDCCLQQRVPLFFKQWGGNRKKKNGRLLDGELWSQMPLIQEMTPVTS
jgi:protein gp37